ncbi:MAG: TonB-dependent receptor plug domain-containing protein [Deltaproteobacteria bacterium]|nr:TonB-dependent receptor plug domain-containing protein [Deltaproteobacteria bacterium]
MKRVDELKRRTQRASRSIHTFGWTTSLCAAFVGLGSSASQAAPSSPSEQPTLGDVLEPSMAEVFDFVEGESKVIWAAARTRQSTDDAPASVTVISREDIRRWGYQSIEDILRHTVGFYIVSDQVIPNAGVRGIAGGLFGDSGNLKVLINGHSVAFRSTGGNWLGPELIPMSTVERVEIVRGPASALYGADAFLGVINIVTIDGNQLLGAAVVGSVDASVFGRVGIGVDGSFGFRKDKFDFLGAASFSFRDMTGLPLPRSSPNAEVLEYRAANPSAIGHQLDSISSFVQLAFHLNSKTKLSAFGYFSSLDRGGEFGPWTPMSNGYDRDGRDNATTISLYQGLFGFQGNTSLAEDLDLNLTLEYFFGGPTSRDRIEVGSDALFVRREFGNRGVHAGIDVRSVWSDVFTTVAGIEYESDIEDGFSRLAVLKYDSLRLRAGEIDESASTRADGTHLWNLGVFGQAQWQILPMPLTLTAGIRMDNHGIYGAQVTGRAAFVARPWSSTTFKLMYGSAFKAPSPFLLYANPLLPGDVIGSPDLRPQLVHTVEGSMSRILLPGLTAEASAGYSRLLDKAEFVQQGLHEAAQNISEMDAWNLDATLRYEGPYSSELFIAIEKQYVTRRSGQGEFQAFVMGLGNPVYPDWIGRAGASADVPGLPLRFAADALVVSSRLATDSNIVALGRPYRLAAYAMLGAELSTHEIEFLSGRETRISIIGRNLLDVRTPDAGFSGVDYPQTPLTLFFQVSQQL